MLTKQSETPDAEQVRENARKAKEAADLLFPNEGWMEIEDGIYLSPNRAVGEKSNYLDELRDARILRDLGSTVYLTPEQRTVPGKKYDAIVDRLKMEFKNMHGESTRTLKDHFLGSRRQAPNVFLNPEKSPLAKREILKALYAIRNAPDYDRKNAFEGGKAILKIAGQVDLVCINVDDLKAT